MSQTNQSMRILSIIFFLVFLLMVAFSFAGENVADSGWKAPESAKGVTNPLKGDQKTLEAGAKIFAQQCATCHGKGGKGDGPASQYLGKELPDFTSAKFQSQTDGELFWKISHGNAPMPTFEKILTEEERWEVINFLRSLSGGK